MAIISAHTIASHEGLHNFSNKHQGDIMEINQKILETKTKLPFKVE